MSVKVWGVKYAKNVDKMNSVNNMKSPANIFIQQKEAAAIENKQILENTISDLFPRIPHFSPKVIYTL